MIKNFSEISLLITAGGESSRMGRDKRLIEIDGETLLERIIKKSCAENFAEIFLCVEKNLPFIEKLADKYKLKIICDEIKKCGPMSGILSGLKKISTEYALTVSCDMPFFDFKKILPLLNEITDEKVIMYRRQPLAAIYHKSMIKNFSESLNNGQRKLQIEIEKVNHKIIDFESEIFFNVNNFSDLKLALGRTENMKRKISIISIVAPSSGTGKTTFIEKIIAELKKNKIRVGVVKSDAHKIKFDVEGKDSWRFTQAGADTVAVVSNEGYFISSNQSADFFEIVNKISGVDLILTESRTKKIFPTISIYRGLGEPIIDENVVAIFSDRKINCEIKNFDINDIENGVKICKLLTHMKN